jgi:hypothetical protein
MENIDVVEARKRQRVDRTQQESTEIHKQSCEENIQGEILRRFDGLVGSEECEHVSKKRTNEPVGYFAIKAVSFTQIVDGIDEQTDAIAKTSVIDDRVDKENISFAEDIVIASSSSKRAKHAAYMANQRSTESGEKHKLRLAADAARKAKSRCSMEPIEKRVLRLAAEAAKRAAIRRNKRELSTSKLAKTTSSVEDEGQNKAANIQVHFTVNEGTRSKKEEANCKDTGDDLDQIIDDNDQMCLSSAALAKQIENKKEANRKRKSRSEEKPEKRQARRDTDAARKRLARAKGSLATVDTVRLIKAEAMREVQSQESPCTHEVDVMLTTTTTTIANDDDIEDNVVVVDVDDDDDDDDSNS